MGENVSMESQICQICGHTKETGAILFDMTLKERFNDKHIVTGGGTCAGCKSLVDGDRIALITISSKHVTKEVYNRDAARTGSIIWMKKPVFNSIFSIDEGGVVDFDFMFIDQEVEDKIKGIIKPKEEGEKE